MANPDFEATWLPRIGPDATTKLRLWRRAAVWFRPLATVLAAGAGASFAGGGPIADVVGWMCTVGAAACCVVYIRAQRRTAAAIRAWFAVTDMRLLPLMDPERFDRWRQANGYRTPEERTADGQFNSGDSQLSREPIPVGSQSSGWPDESGIARWRRKRAEKVGSHTSSDSHRDR